MLMLLFGSPLYHYFVVNFEPVPSRVNIGLLVKAIYAEIEAIQYLYGNKGYWSQKRRGAAISSPWTTTSPSWSATCLDPHPAHLQHILVELFSLLSG